MKTITQYPPRFKDRLCLILQNALYDEMLRLEREGAMDLQRWIQAWCIADIAQSQGHNEAGCGTRENITMMFLPGR